MRTPRCKTFWGEGREYHNSIMAPIDLASFDIALVNFELVQSRASTTTTIRAMYGPERRPLSFVTPACVVHWPKLHGDGDYGTRFGPSELSKAKYSACATDEDLPSGPNEQMSLWFAVVKAIDCKLAQFAHAQQTELFKARGLSLEAVEAKLCAAVKAKEYNARAHEQ
jgi:hypothetical protein